MQEKNRSVLTEAVSTRGRRRLIMAMTAMSLVLCPFVILETLVRVFADEPVAAVDHDPLVNLEHQEPLFVLDESLQQWAIPKSRFNFFRPQQFSSVKGAGVKRIFVLGGSTVQGRPYSTETAFSTWMQLELESLGSEHQFEVINAGGVSYASYRVNKILDEVLQYDPDAIVLYTGHNEFLEDRTYQHVREIGTIRSWSTRLSQAWRTSLWLRSKFDAWMMHGNDRDKVQHSSLPTMSPEVDTRLDQPGGLARFDRDPDWRNSVEQHFDMTLRKMVQKCQSAEIPVLLCVPVGDLVHTPPFKVAADPKLDLARLKQIDGLWTVVTRSESSREQRIDAANKIISLDPFHAGAAYQLGRAEFDSPILDSESGATYLRIARDYDVCPLRATSPIIDSVRRVAAEYGLPVVDTAVLFDQVSSDGRSAPDSIADPDWFLDHVHPTIAGHKLIAKELVVRLRDSKAQWILPIDDAESEKRYRVAVNDHFKQLGEDYFVRGKQRLEGLRNWAAGRSRESIQPDVGRAP